MMKPSRVIEIELTQALETITGLEAFGAVRALVMLQGTPLGWVQVAVREGECAAQDLAAAILAEYRPRILQWLLAQGLGAGLDVGQATLAQLLSCASENARADVSSPSRPSVTVALCLPVSDGPVSDGLVSGGKDSSDCWSKTLAALAQLEKGPEQDLEILVVGAPAAGDRDAYRYVASAESDLSRLRNLAIAQAQGDIIAFLAPDIAVRPTWLSTLVQSFVQDPSVAAMSGPLVPWESMQAATHILDRHQLLPQSFGCHWHRFGDNASDRQAQILFNNSLNPENFALRRSALERSLQAASDEAFGHLDGSIQALAFTLIRQGKTLFYDPRAWVYDQRDQSLAAVQKRLKANTKAQASYFAQGWLQQGAAPANHRWSFFKESLGGLRWSLRCWLLNPSDVRPFHAAEVLGTLAGMGQILSRGLGLLQVDDPLPVDSDHANPASVTLALQLAEQSAQLQEEAFGKDEAVLLGSRTAVRTLDISAPLTLLETLGEYDQVRLFIQNQGVLLGDVLLDHRHGPLSAARLNQAIVETLGHRLLGNQPEQAQRQWQALEQEITDWITPIRASEEMTARSVPTQLPDDVKVSVIITTCDRPTDLRNCLRHLAVQETQREVEIIVADNRPGSGITPPVVAEFPGVRLVSEPRVGGSYGRNSAFCASTGEIVVTVDDDVTVPSHWLEKLLAPMARPEVMCVTGNVLPRELETEAQRMYEDLYGGLSEGFEPFEADGQWLSSFNYSPPVWDLGVSANSAFRASIFHHPEIGMMPEVLGPGTPVGGGEENYLIYRILKAGFTLVYEPSAYAWHRHRRTVPQLRYQIYRQMMGGTAYHLLLWLVDKDSRGLQQLTRSLPRYFTQRIIEKAQGKSKIPWSFLGIEIAGYLSGIPGYWKSLKAVERQGHSTPYVPVAQRQQESSEKMAVPLSS